MTYYNSIFAYLLAISLCCLSNNLLAQDSSNQDTEMSEDRSYVNDKSEERSIDWDYVEEYADEETDESDKPEEIFIIVEDMPTFKKGSSNGFRYYIAQHLRYPLSAAEKGISGIVYVQFTVNSRGKVVDVVVAKSSGNAALDAEAVRVVKSSPRWSPGKQKGKPVNVRFTFPIVFILQ